MPVHGISEIDFTSDIQIPDLAAIRRGAFHGDSIAGLIQSPFIQHNDFAGRRIGQGVSTVLIGGVIPGNTRKGYRFFSFVPGYAVAVGFDNIASRRGRAAIPAITITTATTARSQADCRRDSSHASGNPFPLFFQKRGLFEAFRRQFCFLGFAQRADICRARLRLAFFFAQICSGITIAAQRHRYTEG